MVNTGPSDGMLEKIGAKASNKKSNMKDKKKKSIGSSKFMDMMKKK